MTIKKIGVLTGGGDCPGLNAVIRAVTKKAINDHGWQVIGIDDGYEGLIEGHKRELHISDVSNILTVGGTILGTSNTANPFSYIVKTNGKKEKKDVSKQVIKNMKDWEIDALVAIGGDGTLTVANKLSKLGVPAVGIPKTIDNDLNATDVTFGHDTAVQVISDAIDRLHTTAQSHHRVMVVEVMGRYAGWLALHGGLAGGGDIILLPEIPFSMQAVTKAIKERNQRGKRFSIVVVAEGAKEKGKDLVVRQVIEDSPDPLRLGGIGQVVANEIEQEIGISSRITVLGHLQRGGTPTAVDRILATRFGAASIDLLKGEKFGRMVAMNGGRVNDVELEKAVGTLKTVPVDHPLLTLARSLGTTFGD